MALHYLTVQDVLWINFRLTKKVQPFRYADLEEATYYQYGYGESLSLFPQAARFLTGFLKKRPLAAGNEGTALIACLGFLKINGFDLDVPNVTEWLRSIESGGAEALASIENSATAAQHEHHDLVPNVRATLDDLLKDFEGPLQTLEPASL